MRCALCGKMLWPWQEWTSWVHKLRFDSTGSFYDGEVVHESCGQHHFKMTRK